MTQIYENDQGSSSKSRKLVMRCNLTKKFFMTIPPHALLESNCCISMYEPIFSEIVEESMGAREDQWKRILGAKANGRTCNVYIYIDKFNSPITDLQATIH